MPSGSAANRPPPVVLIVEDDVDTREMYTEWLAFSGFRVLEARTGEEALDRVQEQLPDLIATDLGLKGGAIDGCELCERLKHDTRTSAIPVVAVTGWASTQTLFRAYRSGCDSVLIKPCLPESLLTDIRRLLNLAASEK